MGERSDIANIIGALAVHVDARRWNELLALFAPEVRIDYVSLFGGDAQSMKREELIGGWRKLLPGFTRTCPYHWHAGHNLERRDRPSERFRRCLAFCES